MTTKSLSLSPPNCCKPCPYVFGVYPSPSTIQVELSGHAATNPQRILWSAYKDELNFDSFDLSAVLNLTTGGGCTNSIGSPSTACEPPYPTEGCCNYFTLAWDDYTIDHKFYTYSGGAWVYNSSLSDRRTYPAHKILQCSVYRYEAANQWWALVKAYIQYARQSYAIMWRGAAQIGTSLLAPGTYSVAMDLSCAPFNGDDFAYIAPPPVGFSWPDGVTSAGTATITVA